MDDRVLRGIRVEYECVSCGKKFSRLEDFVNHRGECSG